MQDYYEILQVHPRADQETIQAAYERLRQRHDPANLEGAADELVKLTHRKRDEIERAYALLGDPARRASYDEEQQARAAASKPLADTPVSDDERIDYRPLPPAGRQERPRDFDPQPLLSREQLSSSQRKLQERQRKQRHKNLPAWLVPMALVAFLTAAVTLTSLILTNGGNMQYAGDVNAAQQVAEDHGLTPEERDQLFTEYESQVFQARQVAQSLPEEASAWIMLGNALYDSVQVVREIEPGGETYNERVSRWLEASEAYDQALELGIENEIERSVVRSDMGVALCYYGADGGEQEYVEQGLAHAEQAAQELDQNGRVLLNLGICKANAQPPQTQEALALWQTVLELPATEQGVAQQAQQLVQLYTR